MFAALYKKRMECTDEEYVQPFTGESGFLKGFTEDKYSPYRTELAPLGTEPDVEIAKMKPTIKRPFMIRPKVNKKVLDHYHLVDGGLQRQAVEHEWFFAVGCKIFDGICLNQDDFKKIDCAACIKSLFESLIVGCEHPKFYVDQYGTRRCLHCKDELGQDEDDDPAEMDDFNEDDSPAEEEPIENDDPEMILNHPGLDNYRSWNLEGKPDQTGAGENLEQTFRERTPDPIWDRSHHHSIRSTKYLHLGADAEDDKGYLSYFLHGRGLIRKRKNIVK